MAPPEPQLPPPAKRATIENSCHYAAAADAMDDAAADAPGDALPAPWTRGRRPRTGQCAPQGLRRQRARRGTRWAGRGSARRDDRTGRGEAARAAMTLPGEEAVAGEETVHTATTAPSKERQRTARGPCPQTPSPRVSRRGILPGANAIADGIASMCRARERYRRGHRAKASFPRTPLPMVPRRGIVSANAIAEAFAGTTPRRGDRGHDTSARCPRRCRSREHEQQQRE